MSIVRCPSCLSSLRIPRNRRAKKQLIVCCPQCHKRLKVALKQVDTLKVERTQLIDALNRARKNEQGLEAQELELVTFV